MQQFRNNGTVYYGTNAERLAALFTALEGLFFYETDTGALFGYFNSAWVLITRAAPNIRTITNDDNVLATDDTIIIDGNANTVTATLPTPGTVYTNGRGQKFVIKSIDSTFTATVASTDIDGSATVTLATNEAITVQSDGSVYHIISDQT